MAIRKHKIDMKLRAKPITKEELQFNTWYYNNMEKLGLYTGLEDAINQETENIDYPFKNISEYYLAKAEALEYLMNGKEVLYELAESLIKMKKLNEALTYA